jgi:Fe2+ transport system protein FeoA
MPPKENTAPAATDAVVRDFDHAETVDPHPKTDRLIVVNPVGWQGRYAAALADGRTIVRSSRTPLLDAARRLLELGADPDAIITMRHAGSEIDSLRARIGVAAGLAVREDRGGPEFVRHRPFALDDVRAGTAEDGSASVSLPEAAE